MAGIQNLECHCLIWVWHCSGLYFAFIMVSLCLVTSAGQLHQSLNESKPLKLTLEVRGTELAFLGSPLNGDEQRRGRTTCLPAPCQPLH